MKKLYQMSCEEIEKLTETNLKTGLTNSEILIRQEKGKNELEVAKKVPFIVKFLNQFKDFMIIVLICAALISILAAREYANGLLIIMIVVVNALIGAGQEEKAEKSLDAIKDLSSPHITVLRDGVEVQIDVKDVVVGDIVLLTAGDYVPADARIIESVNLKIDESALTGEAVPVEKYSKVITEDDVPLGDQHNLTFMGTVVTYGKGKAVITSIGMQTEMGKIAEILSETTTDLTPLQKNVAQLGKILALIALAIVTFIFIIEIIQGLYNNWNLGFVEALKQVKWIDSLLFAVSLAVAAIPEGLPAVITVVLSLGMQNLVKQRAIMKTLPAVETLGSTQIICSDKTGTLTENIMTVTQLYHDGKTLKLTDVKDVSSPLHNLVCCGVLVNDSKIRFEENETIRIGDPTELAFMDLALNFNIDPAKIIEKFPRIAELPFSSERKLMSTVHDFKEGRYAVIKGAPDVLIGKANSYLQNEQILTDKKGINNFMVANEEMANQALRVLAIAVKKIDKNIPLEKYDFDLLENDVTLVGLVGMIDPPRLEVKDAVQTCYKAGIETIMITGDHKNTAIAIAKEIKILKENELAITGKELDAMSDEEFAEKLPKIKVYARVSPENKVRIVRAWRDTGKIVAMTGDGVNDAPSIKQADIGIAMGITGTEVAKGAADMVLTDDNFATIVEAVSFGRTIFANIKKAIHFLLSCNIGEILSMFLGVTLGILIFSEATSAHILSPAQILWVNLVTDSFLGIALGMDPREKDVMSYPPRDSKKSVFSGGLGLKIFWEGMLIGLLTFAAYAIGYYLSPNGSREITAQTMAFMVLSLSQLAHALNARSDRYSAFKLEFSKPMLISIIICFILQIIVVILPFARDIFNITLLSWIEWLIVASLSLTPLLVVEIQKLISSKRRKIKEL